MSHMSLPTASASSPGLGNGTSFTGTPRRSAMARAMSGETPSGSPDGVRPVTSRKLLMLMAARSTPCGASSATTDWDMGARSGTVIWRAVWQGKQAGSTREEKNGALRVAHNVCSAQRRPPLRCMRHADDSDRAAFHFVDDDERRARYDQFARASHSSNPSHMRMVGQVAHGIDDDLLDPSRCGRVVLGDVIELSFTAADSLPQPDEFHR